MYLNILLLWNQETQANMQSSYARARVKNFALPIATKEVIATLLVEHVTVFPNGEVHIASLQR